MPSLNKFYLDQKQTRLLSGNYPIYPMLGLFTAALSTLTAINFIPEETYPKGALFLPALIMTVGLAFAPIYACTKSPRTILRAEHLMVISPIYWLLLDLLQGAYPMSEATREGIEGAFIAIGLFTAAAWTAALTRPFRLPSAIVRAASYSVKPKIIYLLILVFFGLGIFRFAYPADFDPIVMFNALIDNRWAAPWSRGALGGWDAFLDHMAYFGYLLPVLTVLLAHYSRRINFRVISSVILSLIMTAFLAQGGGRRIIGVIWGAAIVCWVLQQERINVKKLIVAAVSVGLLLIFMQLMLEYRSTGFQAISDDEKRLEYDYLHVDDNFLRLSQIIERVPEYHPYTYEKQIVYYAVRPIPRILWSGKPVDPGFDLPALLGKDGVSLSSSAIGEFYLSWGWITVLLGGFFYGKLANTISTLLVDLKGSSAILVYSLATMAIVAGMRSIVEIILMSYTLLAWMIVTRILVAKRAYTMVSRAA
ncbi:MAG TPA: O-antigen polymerase [Pyrinomonadaceae bacterium]|jgi:oligosaccharide repeat unit polymerase